MYTTLGPLEAVRGGIYGPPIVASDSGNQELAI